MLVTCLLSQLFYLTQHGLQIQLGEDTAMVDQEGDAEEKRIPEPLY